jgi:hypothetical protein
MAVSADLRSGKTVQESSPPAETAQLRTAGGVATVRGQQRRRRRPPTLLRLGDSSAGPRPMLPPRLPASRRRWPASTRSQIAGPWVAAERWGDVCDGLVFWVADRRARADKGRTRATSLSRPRPRKPVQDLGRVWVVPDAAAIRFRDGSARWAAFLSVSTHPDARARDGSPGWRCPNSSSMNLV